jgi:hypothetical protein
MVKTEETEQSARMDPQANQAGQAALAVPPG